MQFVDTNLFIRYFTQDDLAKQAACAELFDRAERGEVELVTSEAVIGEIVYVLSSPKLYHHSRDAIRDMIHIMISWGGLHIPDRRKYVRAANIYAEQNVDFTDALIVATMELEEITELVSYDKHFNRFKSITRLEPPPAAPPGVS